MLTTKISENGGRAPEAIPYMPAGLHYIHATVNGKEGRRAVMVDEEACARLQADLEGYFAKVKAGKRARPVVYFDHRQGAAAGHPKRFVWCEGKGILLEMEDWTAAGRAAVEGGDYGYVSPAFRMGRDSHTVLGLVDGVEVASLVNDPAFEEIDCIAAAKAGAAAPAGGGAEGACGVDYINAGNPEGCNQFAHAPGCKHGSGRFVALGDTVGLQEHLDDEVEPVEIEFEPAEAGKEWLKDLKAYFQEHLLGRTLEIGSTGYRVSFLPKSQRSAVKGVRMQMKNEVGRRLDDIVGKSYHLYQAEPVHKEGEGKNRAKRIDGSDQYHVFGYPASVNGSDVFVWFCADHEKREPDGKKLVFYEFGIAKNKPDAPADVHAPGAHRATGGSGKVILGDFLRKVNMNFSGAPQIFLKGEDVQAAAVLPPRGEVEKGRPGEHNRDTPGWGCKEELKIMNGELLKLLGLPDDAGAAAVCAAVKKILGERDAHKRKADEVEAGCRKKEEELKAAKADAAAMRVNKLVASGLLAPKDEERIEAARNLAMGDPAAFDAVFAGHVLAGVAAPAEVAGKVPPVPDMERMSLAEMLDKEQ